MKKIDQINEFIRDAERLLKMDPSQLASVRDAAEKSVAYYGTNPSKRKPIRNLQLLEERWYRSLQKGRPDYSIYQEPDYIGDLISCWIIYSSKYLRIVEEGENWIKNRKTVASSLRRVRSVADLGCGLGYTCRRLRTMFPRAAVTGTNVADAIQTKFARRLGRESGFSVQTNLSRVGNVDLVFASEYFEHFSDPVDHLNDVLDALDPDALLIANSFGSISIGHFDEYNAGGEALSSRRINKAFNSRLKARGYTKIRTGLWNDRPAYWSRTASSADVLVKD